jgi:transposase
VKLMAPQFVKPYVKSNKTDRNDAAAICEAMSRPSMRFVEVKSVEQQDIQAVHRVRSELVAQRTSKANQIRGLVGEYGWVAPIGVGALRRALPEWLEDAENGLSDRFRRLLAGLADDLRVLDQRIAELDEEIASIAENSPDARRLLELRGVGPITATALVAVLGTGEAFRRGRDFSVSLGLTPKQHSSGGKERLLGISKRGDAYLRQLLVHGARAVVRTAAHKNDPLSRWLQKLLARRHTNVVVVALASKTARMAWALLHRSDQRWQNPTSAKRSKNPTLRLGVSARIAHQGPVPKAHDQRPDTREQSILRRTSGNLQMRRSPYTRRGFVTFPLVSGVGTRRIRRDNSLRRRTSVSLTAPTRGLSSGRCNLNLSRS